MLPANYVDLIPATECIQNRNLIVQIIFGMVITLVKKKYRHYTHVMENILHWNTLHFIKCTAIFLVCLEIKQVFTVVFRRTLAIFYIFFPTFFLIFCFQMLCTDHLLIFFLKLPACWPLVTCSKRRLSLFFINSALKCFKFTWNLITFFYLFL